MKRTDARLRRGDYVRVRLGNTSDWTEAFVALASDTQPSSVMLLLDGTVRSSSGGLFCGSLPLMVDYEQESAASLLGDVYELEVRVV